MGSYELQPQYESTDSKGYDSQGKLKTRSNDSGNKETLGKQSIRAQLQSAIADDRPKSADDAPSNWTMLKETFCGSNMQSLCILNIAICFIPLGVCAGFLGWGSLFNFGLNFVAMIPLSAILGAATETVAVHLGDSWGGLLNNTMGNLIELVATFLALKAGLVHVVQMSLIGAVISNLLLVMGLSFIAANVKVDQAEFNPDGAGSNISCLVLASLAMVLPTVYEAVPGTTEEGCIALSRIIAVIMALVYVAFLIFQFRTHGDYFNHENKDEDGKSMKEVDKTKTLPAWICVVILCLSSIAMTVCAQFMVDAIKGLSEDYEVPYAFIGLILLPMMSNAPEHTSAVTASYHGMMDLAMNVAIGSSTQISLFIVPYAVIVSWILGVPMTLDFGIFVVTVLILSVFIASGVVGDGNGNWFEGLMLVATYIIVATTTWYIPNTPSDEGLRRLAAVPLGNLTGQFAALEPLVYI